MYRFLTLLPVLALTACAQQSNNDSITGADEPVSEPATTANSAPANSGAERLATILAAQPAEKQARYGYRHPQQTLEFFGITPGMTVVEALPGGGWYTQILLPYLGANGKLIGVDYALDMFPKFGFFTKEDIEAKKTWAETWTTEAESWRGSNAAAVSAAVFGSVPDDLAGTADAVLFIRALHNLNRFENDGGYLTTALTEAHRVLKPGGIVGVVQHEARNDKPDAWADGSKGYLKKAFIIERMEQAGFEYVDASDINANDKDQPADTDIVWRLPPTLLTSRDNPELKTEMQAIGESNRTTLKFRKPQ
ncbi:MAG: class I SAM-dependent methyltransferase [Pseudomonadales bacterium]